MVNRASAVMAALTLSLLAAGCGSETANPANTNTNTNGASTQTAASMAEGTRNGPDNSLIEITREPDVVIETRTFKDPNSQVEKVVVTTRGGRRTARVYYRNNEVRELPDNRVEQALTVTGDTLVSFGGEVADKTEDAGRVVGDKAEDVGGVAKKGVREAADKTEDAAGKAKDVGGQVVDKTKDGAKAVGKGAKKVGGKLKDAVTP